MLNRRISSVGAIKVNTVGTSTTMEIGDSKQLAPLNFTIAVQRERAVYLQNEFDFSEYTLFSIPLVQPVVTESFQLTRLSTTPYIVVQDVNVFITSSSSIVHIGSSGQLNAQSRIKHIRHLLREKPAQD
ncbi:spore germination protein GerPE [Paenibacillus rigui]|uniref:Spore gernimation protein n=1 Tax=Paenibacillus rigui TaxID=554312 RepID=A0A229UUA6_9BACL|nr:spore germination protein GerPE [Paenibacillus rigui]OXM86998.1 spore gernimation protein [Paenibacillus rigui]